MIVLHLEDSDHDDELIASVLQNAVGDCVIRRVKAKEEYEAALATRNFDLILSDHRLPGYDGLMALELARREVPDKPFVFVSGTIGEERAIEALRRGAADYILKDRPSRLPSAIRQVLAHAHALEERRAAEAALRRQASLLDKARDAIIATDMSQRIAYWNMSAERIYGYRASEVFGQRLFSLGLGHDPQRVAEAWAKMMSAGEWRGQFTVQSRQGRTIYIESTWSLVVDNEGHPQSALFIDTDATEKKMLECQVLRADRLDSLGMLAGGVAHDLNNVLAPITMGAELLALKISDPDSRKIINSIARSAEHGASLVQQLLNFARGGEGIRKEVGASSLMADVGKMLQDSLPKTIELKLEPGDNLPHVRVDPTQIKQVLLNLALNARDAMPTGGTLTLSATCAQDDARPSAETILASIPRYVHIKVSDTGTGIPPEVIGKIFDPFFTTKPIGKGTGLGLSTAAGIIKSHGGRIDVDSEVGRGTTFHVYLPAIS